MIDCEKCLKLKDEPDCENCSNPELLPENEHILRFWELLADQRDFNGALRIEAVISLLKIYNGTDEDLEKILIFDRTYRAEVEKHKKN